MISKTDFNKKIQWVPVAGYEGMYEVSNRGDVRSLNRKVRSSFGKERFIYAKVLNQSVGKSGKGYLSVEFNVNNNRKRFYVHRLVGNAFLEKSPGKNLINHKDGNPKNNDVENLEWCSAKENVNHAILNGLSSYTHLIGKGNKCWASKLTEKDVIKIKSRINCGDSVKEISKDFDIVSESAIREIKAGRSWSHINV